MHHLWAVPIKKTGYAGQEIILQGAGSTPVVTDKPPHGAPTPVDTGQPRQDFHIGGVSAEIVHSRTFLDSLPQKALHKASDDPHITIVGLRNPVAARKARLKLHARKLRITIRVNNGLPRHSR